MDDVMKNVSDEVRRKWQACETSLRKLGNVVVAFSGGVDSTLLLALAVRALGADNVLAAIGVSPSLARRERDEGRRLAKQIGAELVEIETHEMSNPAYAANPANRCFYCKTDLFGRLKELAFQREFKAVASGANADDTGDFRPGLQAGRELGILNPLMEAGLTKAEIREISRALDLPTWDKPAMACLASRVPYGQLLSPERLGRIEQAEYVLKDLGFVQCRVRDHDTVARVEVPAADLARLVAAGPQIAAALKKLGYTYVTVDLEGFRSGSMNETLSARTRAEHVPPTP